MKNDLISRQEAIDEANAWLLECLGVHKQNRSCGLIRRLEDLPSAQPEIIRCRDCEHWHDITPVNLKGYQYCHAFRDFMPEGGYCHKAQRREVSK